MSKFEQRENKLEDENTQKQRIFECNENCNAFESLIAQTSFACPNQNGNATRNNIFAFGQPFRQIRYQQGINKDGSAKHQIKIIYLSKHQQKKDHNSLNETDTRMKHSHHRKYEQHSNRQSSSLVHFEGQLEIQSEQETLEAQTMHLDGNASVVEQQESKSMKSRPIDSAEAQIFPVPVPDATTNSIISNPKNDDKRQLQQSSSYDQTLDNCSSQILPLIIMQSLLDVDSCSEKSESGEIKHRND